MGETGVGVGWAMDNSVGVGLDVGITDWEGLGISLVATTVALIGVSSGGGATHETVRANKIPGARALLNISTPSEITEDIRSRK